MMKRTIDRILRGEKIETGRSHVSSSIFDVVNLDYANFHTVFDVGAYHGSFSEAMFHKNPSIEIHAFEPYNVAFEIVKKKFQKKNIIVNNYAVGEMQGERKLHLNNFDETNSLLVSNSVDSNLDELTRNIKEQKVNVITLDDYCNKTGIKNIDLIKIDTQGNSYNVLLGAFDLLTSKRVKYLYVETEFIQIYKDEKCFSEIELFLRNMGYQLVNFYNLNYTQNGRIAWCDCLFTIK